MHTTLLLRVLLCESISVWGMCEHSQKTLYLSNEVSPGSVNILGFNSELSKLSLDVLHDVHIKIIVLWGQCVMCYELYFHGYISLELQYLMPFPQWPRRVNATAKPQCNWNNYKFNTRPTALIQRFSQYTKAAAQICKCHDTNTTDLVQTQNPIC